MTLLAEKRSYGLIMCVLVSHFRQWVSKKCFLVPELDDATSFTLKNIVFVIARQSLAKKQLRRTRSKNT